MVICLNYILYEWQCFFYIVQITNLCIEFMEPKNHSCTVVLRVVQIGFDYTNIYIYTIAYTDTPIFIDFHYVVPLKYFKIL